MLRLDSRPGISPLLLCALALALSLPAASESHARWSKSGRILAPLGAMVLACTGCGKAPTAEQLRARQEENARTLLRNAEIAKRHEALSARIQEIQSRDSETIGREAGELAEALSHEGPYHINSQSTRLSLLMIARMTGSPFDPVAADFTRFRKNAEQGRSFVPEENLLELFRISRSYNVAESKVLDIYHGFLRMSQEMGQLKGQPFLNMEDSRILTEAVAVSGKSDLEIYVHLSSLKAELESKGRYVDVQTLAHLILSSAIAETSARAE